MNHDAKVVCGSLSSSSRQAGYQSSCSSEGNSVAKMEDWTGNVDCLFEFGRTIRITRRKSVRSGDPPVIIIAVFNPKGFLTSKDKLINRWCCCRTTSESTKLCFCWNLKRLWWRHHTDSSSIPEVKSFGNWEETTSSTLSTSTQIWNWLQKLKIKSKVFPSCWWKAPT